MTSFRKVFVSGRWGFTANLLNFGALRLSLFACYLYYDGVFRCGYVICLFRFDSRFKGPANFDRYGFLIFSFFIRLYFLTIVPKT